MPARVDLTLTEAAALGLLALEGERSGYDLLRLVQRSIAHVWSPAKSQLYATLRRLTAAGLVDVTVVAQAGRPDKHVFRISADGWERLSRWLREVVPNAPHEQVLKIFLGGLMELDVLVAHVEQFRADTRARRAVFAEIDRENTSRGHDWFHRRVLELGVAEAEAQLAWAEDALAALRSPAARRARRAAVARIHFAPDGAGNAPFAARPRRRLDP